MRRDRKDRSIEDLLAARELEDLALRAFLDERPTESLVRLLGSPLITRSYHEPIGRWWRQGDKRPALASEDPAVVQAQGRCVVARGQQVAGFSAHRLRSDSCAWCDYPPAELLAACEYASWRARHLRTELLVWWQRPIERSGASYVREGAHDTYEHPDWRDFWALPQAEREERIRAAQYPGGAAA